jgi:excinuclease ABC subunit C
MPHAVLELQRALGLKRPPRRIEAFDISNLGGTDAVGSMVCFIDGKPCKSDYRRFKVNHVPGQDDFAMMREVVGRRYHRLLEEGTSLPDLVLIDGGRGHLSSALETLHGLRLTELEVIGLAKRLDEVYLPHLPDPQNIPRSSSALRLLQHVRDEAHRFAVTYHRSLRKQRTVHSSLEEIPGIGEKRRTALLRHFGSLKRLKQASVEEMESVPGIGVNLAKQIQEVLHQV